MAIVATDTGGGGDFSPMPQGNHVAVCNMVVDLGKQRSVGQYGEKIQHKAFIRWETPDEQIDWTDKDGNEQTGNRVIGSFYTVSLHENATLRGVLESWRGRGFTKDELDGFDITKLLGAPCMINVTHSEKNGKNYANVVSVTPLPKALKENPPKTSLGLLLYDDDNLANYDLLPEWLQKKINERIQPTGKADAADPDAWRDNDLDDDVPF